MENFIVSARKYRPSTFVSVVGQNSITTTLKNAIKNKHLAQAYLFCGPRGVGKTTCARIFAKTINCFNLGDDIEACNECESCISFNNSRSYNIHELDAASNNSVEDIRNLIEQVRIPPQIGKYSIYIIDEVHMLSQAAFNAFLKTLEEPPAHAVFILATTEKHKIIPTILSRCQVFDFNRIQVNDTVEYLEYIAKQENIEYEADAFNVIAQKADGAMRDALSIFDQIVSFSGSKITYQSVIENLNILDYEYFFKLTDAFLGCNTGEALMIFNDILNNGFDGHNFINGLSSHFRDLLVCKDTATIQLLEVGASIGERYKTQSTQCSGEFLFEALNICNTCDVQYKSSQNQRLLVELTLMRLCNICGEKKNSKPDVNQNTKIENKQPQQSQNNQTVSETQKSQVKDQTAVKTAIEKPKSSFPQTTPSIKDALNGVKRKKDNSEEEKQIQKVEEKTENLKPETSFEYNDLLQKWDDFAESIKETKPRMYSTLKNNLPILKDKYIIEYTLNNTDQQDDFNKMVKADLVGYLCKELNNYKIQIVTNIIEVQGVKRPYTAEEKFEHMSKKNPALNKLKQQFNLDFE